MKLYSKTISDKGKEKTKGGNTFIRIDFFDERRERIATAILKKDNNILVLSCSTWYSNYDKNISNKIDSKVLKIKIGK